MNNHGNPLFTLHKPDERPLLEIWHIGFGPNITYGLCVADSNPFWTDPADRQPLIVRYGFPPGQQIEYRGLVPREGSISQAEVDELLEPLKHIQVPPARAKRHLSATARFTVSQRYCVLRVSVTSGILSRRLAGNPSQSGSAGLSTNFVSSLARLMGTEEQSPELLFWIEALQHLRLDQINRTRAPSRTSPLDQIISPFRNSWRRTARVSESHF